MINSQNLRFDRLFSGKATNATTTSSSANLDCKGYKSAKIIVIQSPATATNSSDKMTTMQLAEADATGTSYTAITDFTGSTNSSVTSGFVIQTNTNTTIGIAHEFNVDLRKRMRYLTAVFAPTASHTQVEIVSVLGRGEIDPSTATLRGVALSVTA